MPDFYVSRVLFRQLYFLTLNACCQLLLAFAVLLVAACEKRPANNSTEYLQEHGVTIGVENSIRVAESTFVIPANIPFEVFTEGDIKKGVADTLTIYLDFSYLLKDVADTGVLSPASVRVEIKNLSSVDGALTLDPSDGEKWASITTLYNIGLTEFRAKRFDGGWGYISYQDTDPSARTLTGTPIQFSCRGSPESGPDMCWSSFTLNREVTVWYFLSYKLLPHWNKVHHSITKVLHIQERK